MPGDVCLARCARVDHVLVDGQLAPDTRGQTLTAGSCRGLLLRGTKPLAPFRRIVLVMAETPPPDRLHIAQALRMAADNVEHELARASGLDTSQLAILILLDLRQPATIPDVAAGVGHGYRWARAVLEDLRKAGLVVRWPSNPARFALADSGTKLVEHMNAAIWESVTSAHGWPAAVIVGRVLDLLGTPTEETAPIELPGATASLSNVSVAADFLGVEAHIIEAWVRSGALQPPPWTETDLASMNRLAGSVAAVWSDLLVGARDGHKFADVASRLGITTQKVAFAISREAALRAELDEALMQGRDPMIQHGQRLAYRQGCWCPECRRMSPSQTGMKPKPT